MPHLAEEGPADPFQKLQFGKKMRKSKLQPSRFLLSQTEELPPQLSPALDCDQPSGGRRSQT
jgi:hypothetical protein